MVLGMSGAGISFLAQTLLAKVAGPNQFGLYTYVITWVTVLALLSKLGLDPGLISFGNRYLARDEVGIFRAMVLRGTLLVLGAGTVCCLLFAAVGGRINHGGTTGLSAAVIVGAAAIPFFGCLTFSRVIFACQRRQVAAVVAISSVQNGSMLAALIAWIVVSRRITAFDGLILFLGSVVLALGSAVWLLRDIGRQSAPAEHDLRKEVTAWLSTGAPLLLVTVGQFILGRADLLVLGATRSSRDVGIYAAAILFTAPMELLLASVTYVVGPEIAQSYQDHRRRDLQRILSRSIEALMLISVPFVLGLVLLGHVILGFLGSAYQHAYVPMVLLGIAQVVSLLTGSSGYALSVTEHGRALAALMVPLGALTMVVYLLLIPRWGPAGAAWATVLTMTCRETAVSILVSRRMGVVPLPFVSASATRNSS